MVKNLPTVERSTQIRFGKHVPEGPEQAENTIIFNASNDSFPTEYSNAVYLSPIRNRTDYTAPEIVLLMYDRNTKEITESGESANALIGGSTLDTVVNRSNATSNTAQFIGGGMLDNGVAFVTDSNIGISNLLPQHTVSVGSNLYIDDVGSNVLVVSGNVAILDNLVVDGNLRVNGGATVIYTENTAIRDPLIELGTNNGASDTTLDLGILMHRPDALSNVVIGYREDTDEFALAYTDAKPSDNTFTPKTDEDINVHVYGLTHVDANIYAHEDILVTGNTYISGNVVASKDFTLSGNAYVDGNVVASKDFTLTGNAYVSGNVSITEELTVSNNVYADKDLEVVGNVYVDGNVVAYKDFTLTGNAYVTGNVVASKDFTLSGNAYVTGNVVASKDFTLTGNAYVSGNVSITEELTVSNNVYADKDLEVVGNVYVDGNVVAYKDFTLTGNAYVTGNVVASKDFTLSGNAYVDGNVTVTEELTVSNNVYADKDLEVMGNVYVDGNVVAYKDFTLTGNAYVSGNVSITEEMTVSNNVYADKDLEVVGNVYVDGNVVAYKDFTLTGNAYVTGNVNITNQLTVTNNAYVTGNVQVTEALIVSGNTHLEGDNVFITHTMDFLDPTTAIVTDQISNVQIRLGQLENVANTASNPLVNQVLAYDNENNEWANCYPDQTILQVKNTSGGPITRGQALHVKGSNGNNIFQVDLADASDPTKMPAIGIAYEDMADNAQGAAVSFGRANGISGISGYTNGQTLYVASGTPGGLTNIKPYGVDLDLIQNVGVVVNNSSGVVFVTGIGRSNDIPNARIITDYNDMQYVYVNNVNNDLKKIASENLNIPLTTAVSSSSNSAANAVTLRGVSITSGDGFHGDLVVAGNVTVDSTTLHVDAETSRVGVGTVRPGQPLDVRGAANVGALVTTSTVISDATVATDQTSGALRVTGGVGIGGDLYAADTTLDSVTPINLTSGTLPITDESKKLVDSLISQNGTGKLIISANVEITGNISVLGNSFAITSNDLIINDRIIDLANNNVSSTLDVGVLMEHPGKNIFIGHHTSPDDYFSIGYTSNGYAEDHVNWNGTDHITANIWGHLITQNTVTVEYGNVYIVDGGLGIGIGQRYDDNIPDSKLYVTGNAHFTSNISTDSNVLITGDAAATSTTTGALQVTGGVGVQGALYGAEAYFGGVTSVTNSTAVTGKTDGALVVVGGVGISGDIHATHANLEDVEADSVTVTDATTSTSTTTGALKVTGGVSTQEKLNVGGVAKIWDSTAVTGKTDGALVVVGGVGISGDIHATHANLEDVEADSVTVTDATTSTSTTTGALKVTGGVSTQEKLNVGGVTKIWDSTAVTGKTDGALVVVGGVGISGDIHATHANLEDVEADSVNVTDTTESTDTQTGAVTIAGGLSTQTNVHASNVYTTGGLITNTGGTAKKTYSHAGTLPTNATVANATFAVVFSNHVFHAKITAILVEGAAVVSSFTQECCGGHITGGTPGTITLGGTTVIGHSACPWSTEVTSDATTVTFKADQAVEGAGNYNIFVEYLSAHTGGRVLKFTEGGVDEITFNY
jgi:predicted acyltransferase (DUF342 family)